MPRVTRRSLIRGSALGAAGAAALAAPMLTAAPASAATSEGIDETWINVVGAGADPTGKTDSTAVFQAAINNTPTFPVYVPAGTYLCSGTLTPVPGMRLFGDSCETTTITTNSGNPLFNMDPGSLGASNMENIEIDHLTLSSGASGGDIFWGSNTVRSSVHDCHLIQRNPASAIWHVGATTGAGNTYMAECDFYFNKEMVYGNPRSTSAWNLSPNPNGGLRFNDNQWTRNVCFNVDKDPSQTWYRLVGDLKPGEQGGNNNRFQKITFEFPTGGMIHLESTTGDVIEDVTSEDLTTLTVGNPLIQLGTASGNNVGCSGIAIRDYSRHGR